MTYDPAGALALLETIGYKKDGDVLKDSAGNPVTFNVGTPTKQTDKEYLIAQDWIQDLKAAGIDASLSSYEQAVWFPKVDSGDWDAGVWWFCGATVDPVELYQGYTCDRVAPIGDLAKNGNSVRACNKDFDDIIIKLKQVTPDDPSAKALYMSAYDKWMEQAFGVPLIETYYPADFNTTYWTGFPSSDNLYTVPFNWWGQIMWILFNAKPK
jgi:peptide/nickel transport system substrate-binding protein